MPQLFTVRWPFFARLEAVLFFPVTLMLAWEFTSVQTIVDDGVLPVLYPSAAQIGLPDHVTNWIAVAIVVIVPYLTFLLVVDRFLTVRKGYALLSSLAIAAWAGSAFHLAGQLPDIMGDSLAEGTGGLSVGQQVSIVAGGLAFLLHLKPMWTGLRDEGDVAMRLLAVNDYSYRRAPVSQPYRAQDVYYRQTADLRGWMPQEELDGLGGGPRENTAVKILSAVTWIAVVGGVGAAYHNWNNLAAANHKPAKAAAAPDVQAGVPTMAGHGVHAAVPASSSGLPLSPLTASPTPQTVVSSALPAVQRPTMRSNSVQTPNMVAGADEAVAERGPDGHFAFDAIVNGTHLPMLFDTGASAVALRAEDAVNLGISVARLNYSAKVKTANGVADVAPITIDTITIGNITLRHIPGSVARPGMLQVNLLGQSFLARLSGFNVENNLLVLKGR